MVNLLLADDFVGGLLNVLSLIMTLADAALVVYAVYMFFMMMTAHDEAKRRNVKKHFFNTLSAILIIIALIGTLSVMKVNIGTVNREQDSSSNTSSAAFSASLSAKSITISRTTVSGGAAYMFKGTVNILISDIKSNVGSYQIVSVDGFASNATGDFASGWAFNVESNGLSATFTKTSTSGVLFANRIADKPGIYFTITVKVKNVVSNSTTAETIKGELSIKGNGDIISFK